MNQDLESELRRALRRQEPSRDLLPVARVPKPALRAWSVAIAAALLVAVGAPAYRVYEQRRAKDQLVFALRLTAAQLQRAKTHIQTLRTDR